MYIRWVLFLYYIHVEVTLTSLLVHDDSMATVFVLGDLKYN
jgi:hypothetical protein